jgi:hypothetical protein
MRVGGGWRACMHVCVRACVRSLAALAERGGVVAAGVSFLGLLCQRELHSSDVGHSALAVHADTLEDGWRWRRWLGRGLVLACTPGSLGDRWLEEAPRSCCVKVG